MLRADYLASCNNHEVERNRCYNTTRAFIYTEFKFMRGVNVALVYDVRQQMSNIIGESSRMQAACTRDT